MILVDMSQIMFANLMIQVNEKNSNQAVDENMLRHMILNSIRSYRSKYKKDYGELVLAFDGAHSWRKNVFPYYKKKREQNRVESPLDWNSIFESLGKIQDELDKFFPYPVIKILHAEGDDIISSMVQKYGNDSGMNFGEPILIISGDKDFNQLQRYANVQQFDPRFKKWIKVDDPESALREHIIRGDVSDGIPNILSPDDSFVSGIRQKPITEKKIAGWIKAPVEEFCTEENMLRNYIRNKTLIDLAETPQNIYNQTIEKYQSFDPTGRRKNLMSYFIKNRLTNLMDTMGDF